MALDGRESTVSEEKQRAEVGEADTVVQWQGSERLEDERSERDADLEGRKRNTGESRTWCAPQKVDATSRSNFFEPIFMVQPAENISRSDPAIAWQLMAMDAWARPRSAVGIRNAWPQARMGSSLIVVGNPLPQDRPKMLLAQRDHVVQAFPADRSHKPFAVSIGLRRLHGCS